MKKIFIISILSLAFGTLSAQFQTGMNQGAFQNIAPELENQALSMWYGVPQVNFSAGTRIDGFNNRPVFQSLFFSSPIGNNTGAAMHIKREKAGLSSSISADLSFLYTLNIAPENATMLVFHGSGSFQQNSFNINDIVVNHIDDPILSNGTMNQPTGNASTGLALISRNRFYAGINASQLLPVRNAFLSELWDNKTQMRLGFQGAYIFTLNEYSSLQTWTSGAYSSKTITYQIGLDFKYRKIFWIGVGYRDNSSLIFNTGVTAHSFSFGYSFSYSSWADAVVNGATYAGISNVLFVRKVFNEQKAVR